MHASLLSCWIIFWDIEFDPLPSTTKQKKGKNQDLFFVVNVFSKILEEWELHNPANNPPLKMLARIKGKIPGGADKSDNQNGQLNIG